MRYVISYDLIAPGKNYQALWDALAALGAQKVLLSEWVVRLNQTTAAAIRDHLRPSIDSNDRLFVVCLDSTDWAGWNLLVNLNGI